VPLRENRSALLATRRLAAALLYPSRRCPFHTLLFHGSPGTGKTAIADALHERVAGDCTVKRLAACDWPGGADAPELNEALRSDLLIVEDLQHLPGRLADELILLLDERRRRQMPTLVTARQGPAGLELPGRLRSRLAGGLCIELGALSRKSRLRLLRRLAEQRGMHVNDGVFAWLARRVHGSARQLIAALGRVETLHNAGVAPTVEDLVTAFRNDVLANQVSLERIVRHVSNRFAIPVAQLRGEGRHPQTVWPRQLSMYLARRLTRLPLARIGAYFGRDFSTVRHACRKVAAASTMDAELSGLLRQMAAELG
jgi:chromosomal replication initiator protein